MLVIRQAQMDAFEELDRRRFEEAMFVHVGRFFPATCAALGEDGCLRCIRGSMARAERHGFVTQRDVCKYIDLAFTLGPDFDVDPALPWAAAILATSDAAELKMDRLIAGALREWA